MSRSIRHTKIFGNSIAESEHADKRRANRKLRAAVRTAMASGVDPLPTMRDVSSVWGFAKDGRNYWTEATAKDMRK